MLRNAINIYYKFSAYFAGTALCLICTCVFVQVLFNTINKGWEICFGSSPGLLLPSYDAMTGFLLVAATFFAAADTFQKGKHIRVNLLVSRVKSEKALFIIEAFSVGIVLALMAYASWCSIGLTLDSYKYNDVSPGIVPIPLWIPQVFMVLGLLTFIIALTDNLIQMLITGKRVIPVKDKKD